MSEGKVTKERMLQLFDFVTEEIKRFGPLTPAICKEIRKAIVEYPEEKIDD